MGLAREGIYLGSAQFKWERGSEKISGIRKGRHGKIFRGSVEEGGGFDVIGDGAVHRGGEREDYQKG